MYLKIAGNDLTSSSSIDNSNSFSNSISSRFSNSSSISILVQVVL